MHDAHRLFSRDLRLGEPSSYYLIGCPSVKELI